jgi:hypothetical protein
MTARKNEPDSHAVREVIRKLRQERQRADARKEAAHDAEIDGRDCKPGGDTADEWMPSRQGPLENGRPANRQGEVNRNRGGDET